MAEKEGAGRAAARFAAGDLAGAVAAAESAETLFPGDLAARALVRATPQPDQSVTLLNES